MDMPEGTAHQMAGFRKGLSETGFVEGKNLSIEYRAANNDIARLPGLATDLVRGQVSVLFAHDSPSAQIAKTATTSIPIVFQTGVDPVQSGLVASLNRPGSNITGVTSLNVELASKRLGLLQELLPRAVRFALLINPANPTNAEPTVRDVQAIVAATGRQIEVVSASTNREIDAAMASIAQKRAEALLIMPDAFFNGRRVQLATQAIRYGLPAIFSQREFAEAGGMMSYGPSIVESYRQAGIYTGRILKGEKPAELPVMRMAKFEFVINLQTARTLGIEVPPTLRALADEVIE